jgi:hypothetical protein
MSGFYKVNVVTTGSNGAATGTADINVKSGDAMLAVYVDYGASAPATTTVDIDEVGGFARKVIDLAASATDKTIYPRVQAQDATGANITGEYLPIVLSSPRLRVTVAASNALDPAVTVYVQTGELT